MSPTSFGCLKKSQFHVYFVLFEFEIFCPKFVKLKGDLHFQQTLTNFFSRIVVLIIFVTLISKTCWDSVLASLEPRLTFDYFFKKRL